MSYPRTCRSGHVINGPEDEHHGEHRQCWECRARTQSEANARYKEYGGPGYWKRRTRELAEQRAALPAQLAEVQAAIAEFYQKEAGD